MAETSGGHLQGGLPTGGRDVKFALKMIALISALLALSLGTGGFLVIQSACRNELTQTVSEAQEDMMLFGTTLQALCLVENSRKEPRESVKRVLQNYSVLDTYHYYVYDQNGRPLTGSGEAHPEDLTGEETGIIETRILERGGQYMVVSSQKLLLMNQVFGITRSRDITGIIRQVENNLRKYELIMLVILLTGMLLTTLFTSWMTRPLRSISRGARRLSDGRLDSRVRVQSNDELGELAREFNRMADALEEKVHALQDAAERQKDFTASFAHELKTPLTSVIGYADTLRSRMLPREQQIEAANYIFSEGKRLEAISFALLDLFALERETPEMKAVPVGRLAEEVQHSLSYLLHENDLELVMDLEPASVSCAPELMKDLLYNLIDNARKASKPGDSIELYGKRIRQEDNIFSYRFTVTDHGNGIPKEALERLTEPFYMVDKSRARAKGGSGLGLALCKKIAEVHHGKLVFDSVPGKGTSVSLEIGGSLS